MKRVCAWCQTELPSTPSDAPADAQTTHTICDDCFSNIEFQTGVNLQRYLDAQHAPIVVVEESGNIATLNAAAQAMLGMTPEAVSGLAGGIVFECAYARLPGGCGKTTHCSGCTIRRTVMATFTSGDDQCCVPAHLTRLIDGVQYRIELSITTHLVHGVVLLRIHTMQPFALPGVDPALLEGN